MKAVWSYLKGLTKKCKWDGIFGYSFCELKTHLASQFTEELSWDNYGTEWELDHKKPVSWFLVDLYSSKEDYIKDVWKLSNVQPLKRSENASKCNRYESI